MNTKYNKVTVFTDTEDKLSKAVSEENYELAEKLHKEIKELEG